MKAPTMTKPTKYKHRTHTHMNAGTNTRKTAVEQFAYWRLLGWEWGRGRGRGWHRWCCCAAADGFCDHSIDTHRYSSKMESSVFIETFSRSSYVCYRPAIRHWTVQGTAEASVQRTKNDNNEPISTNECFFPNVFPIFRWCDKVIDSFLHLCVNSVRMDWTAAAAGIDHVFAACCRRLNVCVRLKMNIDCYFSDEK